MRTTGPVDEMTAMIATVPATMVTETEAGIDTAVIGVGEGATEVSELLRYIYSEYFVQVRAAMPTV